MCVILSHFTRNPFFFYFDDTEKSCNYNIKYVKSVGLKNKNHQLKKSE